MKKIVLFCLLLMAAAGMQAQSLDGTWKYTMTEDDAVDMFFIFDKGSVSLNTYCDISDPVVGTMTLLVILPGSYTRNGDNLNIQSYPDQCELKIEKMQYSDELREAFKEQPELESTIRKIMYDKLLEGKATFAEGFKQFGDVTILKLTDKELWLYKDGDADKVVLARCTE